MAITDTQWANWLVTDTQRILLAEVRYVYESAGAPVEGTLYFSCGAFISGRNDSPPNQLYRNVILGAQFSRSLDSGSQGGQAQFGLTDLTLDNRDGSLDFLHDAIIDGRDVKFYLGDPSWSRNDFRLVLACCMERVVSTDETTLAVKLRDRRLLLDRDVKGDAVGGTDVNSTEYLPLLWGQHINLEPIVYDSSTLTYGVFSNYNVYTGKPQIVDLRDDGVSLRSGGFTATAANTTVDATTDTFTHTAHGLSVDDVIFFATPFVDGGIYTYWAPFPGMLAQPYWVKTVPGANTFTLSATKGGPTLDITGTAFSDPGPGFASVIRQRWFDDTPNTGRVQLSSTPNGHVTLDLFCGKNWTPYALALDIIQRYGLAAAADIDTAAFTAADTALGAKLGYGIFSMSVMDRTNLIDVLNTICTAGFGWYGDSPLGQITCGLLDTSGLIAVTPTREFGYNDVMDNFGVENLAVTIGRADVLTGLNHTEQPSALSSVVTPANRARYGTKYAKTIRSAAPTGTAYATNKPVYHKTMTDAAPAAYGEISSTSLGGAGPFVLTNYAQELVDDRAPHLKVITTSSGIDKYDWKLGELVRVTHPRFGFALGQHMRLIATTVDLVGFKVSLQFFTQTTPKYLTASYN
jgi:hypothetical protein